jgi:hypothetical protein
MEFGRANELELLGARVHIVESHPCVAPHNPDPCAPGTGGRALKYHVLKRDANGLDGFHLAPGVEQSLVNSDLRLLVPRSNTVASDLRANVLIGQNAREHPGVSPVVSGFQPGNEILRAMKIGNLNKTFVVGADAGFFFTRQTRDREIVLRGERNLLSSLAGHADARGKQSDDRDAPDPLPNASHLEPPDEVVSAAIDSKLSPQLARKLERPWAAQATPRGIGVSHLF